MKVLVLNDGSDYQNWGIKACIDGLLGLLEASYGAGVVRTIKHAELHQRYSFEPSFRTYKFFSGEGALERKLRKEMLPTPKFADDFDRVWLLWQSNKNAQRLLGRLEESEVVIFNGEGSTYRNNYAAIKCLFILWVAKEKLKKRTFFVNGSITLSDVDNVLQGIIERSLQNSNGILVRERMSLLQVNKRIKNLRVDCAPDSVYSLSPLSVGNFDRNHDVAFSASMLPMDYRFDLKYSALPGILRSLLGDKGRLKILAKDIEDQDAVKILGAVPGDLLGPSLNYEDVSAELSKVASVLSGRYHHLIFALMSGTPVIPMDTSSHKIKGLVNWYDGLIDAPIDPTNLKSLKQNLPQSCKKTSIADTCRLLFERSAELSQLCERTYKDLLTR